MFEGCKQGMREYEGTVPCLGLGAVSWLSRIVHHVWDEGSIKDTRPLYVFSSCCVMSAGRR